MEVIMNIFKRATLLLSIKDSAGNSLRKIAEKISTPKSNIHRHLSNRKKRVEQMGHDFFETQEGIEWLCRLLFSTIFIFGIQAGVGSETISLYFHTIFISVYVGVSANVIRKIKNEMRIVISDYGDEQMKEIIIRCIDKELHLGSDETYFSRELCLITMELKSGFILTETLEQDRKFATWWKCIGGIIQYFKKIASFTSDGANALKKIGAKVKCKNIMDLFHLQQDIKKLFATKFYSKERSLSSQAAKIDADNSLSALEKTESIKSINHKLAVIKKGQKSYRRALFTVSTQSHPFKDDLTIKTSSELKEQLLAEVKTLQTVLEDCEIIDKKNMIKRIKNRIVSFSQLNDLWHRWTEQILSCKTNSPEIKKWSYKVLALAYFEEQLRKSKRKKWLRPHYKIMLEKAILQLKSDPLTRKYLTSEWMDFAKEMSLKYQRTTSAIEGRNARLSQHYFSTRGIKAEHVKPLTVIANFWVQRDDKTTAAERLCGFKPPDLFEYILKKMDHIPLPRQRDKKLTTAFSQLLPSAI